MLPDIQLALRPGIIEMGWGHPDPSLLPVTDIARAAGQALQHDSWAALAYGAEPGPGRLRRPLAAWLSQREAVSIDPDQLFITGGISQGLDLLCTLLTRPGDAVLVQTPVYHLALRIFADHGLEFVPVASDAGGLRLEALTAALADLQAQGRRPRFLYTVPTWCNPTGISLADERRRGLASLAGDDLLILEDDAYRELWYDAPSPPSLQSLARSGVARLGSFSKILAPGLRLGWLVAAPDLIRRCAGSGLLDSGGGVNHFTAHVAASYLDMGLLGEHIGRLRAAYRSRRDVLLAALARCMPAGCTWQTPGGGFFAWVCLPAGCDSTQLLAAAETAGVSFVPGARFHTNGEGGRSLRLAFSLLPAEELIEGVRRLAEVMRSQQH